MILASLETAIDVLIWISADHFNNLHVKQAALAMEKKGGAGIMFNSFAAVWVAEQPFIPSFFLLQTCTILVVSDTALIKQSTKTCFNTVTPLWRTLDSTLTILKPTCGGRARSFHYELALKDTRNQRSFVGCLSTVATTTSSIFADFLLYTFYRKLRC